ncbi:MAG: molecular chaperone TorD family protein [Coriobacteriales bacterium]|jgi:TorA maturation chaperone TorD|nr:molecular chaperone TorD family protein [Coriobacteriales bacterium]
MDWNNIWQSYSRLYSFFGNSLLSIMTPETSVGLDPAFWRGFPLEGEANSHLAAGLSGLIACTEHLGELDPDTALERVGVEYTRLFLGPGKPAAPPWETLYREGGTVLFGEPTRKMRQLFAEEGLRASADSHQFEDHLGFELLYLGVRSALFADSPPPPDTVAQTLAFIREHPLGFIGELHAQAASAGVIGYYPALLELIWGFLILNVELLEEWQGDGGRGTGPSLTAWDSRDGAGVPPVLPCRHSSSVIGEGGTPAPSLLSQKNGRIRLCKKQSPRNGMMSCHAKDFESIPPDRIRGRPVRRDADGHADCK